MTTDLADIQHFAQQLVADHGARDSMYEDIRKIFHMEWSDKPRGDWIKETMSPTGFNQVMGATRLMTSTEPSVSVPFDEAAQGARAASEKIERACKAMWAASGRAMQRPAHYDLVFSGILFGEMVADVTATADLVRHAEAGGDKRNINRMQALARRTPYLFNVYNPAICYPDYDEWGLRGLLRRTETTWGQVLDTWGSLADDGIQWGTTEPNRKMKVTLCDWYDWGQRAVWLEQRGGVILHEDHGLDFLPVVAVISEGSTLFRQPEQQRFPLLYAVWKSGLWRRENLSLTMIFSLIFALGSNPMLVFEGEEDSTVKIDRSLPAGLIRIKPGEKLTPLAEKVLDPAQTYGLDVASRLNEESTISKMALGAPPKDALAFSAISLLVQSGRLPLMGVKQMGGKASAELMTQALRWWKANAGKGKLYAPGGGYVELAPADIPDDIEINVNLEPDLPTDKLNMANVAERLVSSGLASRRWVRENILNVGQSESMDKEIWDERRKDSELEARLAEVAAAVQLKVQQAAAAMQQAQQQAAQQAQQPAQSGMAPMGQPQNGRRAAPATVYPEGGVGEGAPLAGPLPPQGQPGPMEGM